MKNSLSKLKPGSAEYVVTHAVLRKQRGKKASMSYKNERNPRKALLLAEAELRIYASLDSWRREIDALREHSVSPQDLLERIEREIKRGSFTLESIGSSKREFKRFRIKNTRRRTTGVLFLFENVKTSKRELRAMTSRISFLDPNVALA